MPPPPPGLAGDYFKVFAGSGYMYVVGAMQLLSGLLLLIGRFVPLALTILAAMVFNIWTFHILMDPKGLVPMAIVVAVLSCGAVCALHGLTRSPRPAAASSSIG